jgi:ketosteroid isomerase-like protein
MEKPRMTIVRVRAGAVVLMGLMLMPLAAYSDDAADVLTTQDRAIALFNAGDADGLAPMLAENFIGYLAASPIVVDGRDSVVQEVRHANTINERSQFVSFGDRQVRINGRTAVTAGTWRRFWKPVDGPTASMVLNSVATWVKIGREWKLASFMTRPVPQGSVP